MESPRAGFIAIGRVLGAWGIHGALKVESLTDFPERFTPGARVWLRGTERTVEASHARRGGLVLKLSGVDSPEEAGSARDTLLELPEAEIHPLGEDEYYQHDLIGLSVVSEAGEALGQVAELLSTGANEVLIVRNSDAELLIPLIEAVVRSVDLDQRTIVVELLPGLEPRPLGRPVGASPRTARRARKSAAPGAAKP
jgi:16S rRNA processing protein RimM